MTDYTKFFSATAGAMRESAIRQMGTVLAQATDIVSFAPGYPAEDEFPWRAFAEIAAGLLGGADGSVLQYGPTRGYMPLREAVAGLMADRDVRTTAEHVMITSGSQQGLDLVARVLLGPGDVALLELPSYTGAITAFRAVGASLVGVRQAEDGIDLEDLDRVFAKVTGEGRRVKFVYVVPNFQNPSGALLRLEKRRRLLEWVNRHDVLLVEDDPYRDVFFEDTTTVGETRPIAADDADGRVVYLSSFSKTLAPGFRVAWIVAPAPLLNKFEMAKQAGDLCTGGLDQRVVYEACRRGILAEQLPRLRAHYQRKRDVMSAALARRLNGDVTWAAPRGGFFLWLRLRDPLRSDVLLPAARAHGVIFVTGSAFFVNGEGHEFLRLSFSAPAPDRIETGVERLAAAVGEVAATADVDLAQP
jgi:2-aminoadipate transaminase